MKKTEEQFIKDSKEKITLICKKHNHIFNIEARIHLHKKGGCKFCASENRKNSSELTKKTEEQFIKDSKEKFGDRFDYSKCKYTGTKNNITLICKICNTEFIINSHNHLNSVDGGCKICAIKKVSESKRLTQEEVIKRCKERKNEKDYDYSKIKYIDAYTKIEIVCKKHGSFWMLPYNFYGNYQDCPRCFESKAEKEIENFLISKNIAYKYQMSFPDLKDERKLFYDFYLEKQNLLIECQGEQHYRPVEYFGGEEKFKLQKYHDKLKKEYSLKHNYNFLEIPYWEKDVVGFLINKINI